MALFYKFVAIGPIFKGHNFDTSLICVCSLNHTLIVLLTGEYRSPFAGRTGDGGGDPLLLSPDV